MTQKSSKLNVDTAFIRRSLQLDKEEEERAQREGRTSIELDESTNQSLQKMDRTQVQVFLAEQIRAETEAHRRVNELRNKVTRRKAEVETVKKEKASLRRQLRALEEEDKKRGVPEHAIASITADGPPSDAVVGHERIDWKKAASSGTVALRRVPARPRQSNAPALPETLPRRELSVRDRKRPREENASNDDILCPLVVALSQTPRQASDVPPTPAAAAMQPQCAAHDVIVIDDDTSSLDMNEVEARPQPPCRPDAADVPSDDSVIICDSDGNPEQDDEECDGAEVHEEEEEPVTQGSDQRTGTVMVPPTTLLPRPAGRLRVRPGASMRDLPKPADATFQYPLERFSKR